MNFLFVSILVFISPTLSEIREDLLLPYPKLRGIFSKLKKRQGDGGYLEQCGIVDFGERKLGTVNVLAFFDAGWQYSHRQADRLKELKVRFDRSGMMNINFFVINLSPTTIIDEGEIEIEEETWKAISPTEAEGFPLVETSLESLNKTLGHEFYLIQDNSQLEIWKKLHVSRDQILVIDGCGKLTYQVIVPWSILHFPYVKAAILSTYKDEPCGSCKKFSQEDKPEKMRKEEIGTEELKISDDRAMTALKIEETSTEQLKTGGTTRRFGLEERTTEEMRTTDDTTTIRREMQETTTEQTKTDGTVTVLLEIEGTTIEQMVIDAATTSRLDMEEETIRKQLKADGTIPTPSEIEGTTIEQVLSDAATTIRLHIEEETTTKQSKTDEAISIPSEIEEATTEQMKTVETTTVTLKIEEKATTKQIKTGETISLPSEIEEITIEQLKTDAVTAVSLTIEEETTTEQIKTGGTASIPSQIKETTTEQAKTSAETTVPLTIEEETTKKQIKTGGTVSIPSQIKETTTEQAKRSAETTVPLTIEEETTTEQIKTGGTISAPSEIDETTIEQLKTDAATTVTLTIEEETTEEIKTGDDTTSRSLKIKETTPEQTETVETIPLSSKIKETTTEQRKTDVKIPLSLEIEKKIPKEMKTTFSETDHLNFQEKDHKSENPKPETETLKPTLDLANNNSKDLEYVHSKFPNVRSISKEIYKNQLSLDRNFQNGSNKNEENSKSLPIRIIMKAPHLDVYENSLIKHDYLILMTGDPDLHEHFDRGIKIDSSEGNFDFEEGSADFANRDIWKIEDRDLNQNKDEIKINNLSESRNGWYGFRVKIEENVNEDLRKIKKRIFGKDESPGLYGEVADYWRNDGIENFYEEAFDNEDDKIYDMENDPSDYSEISEGFKSENYFQGTEETNEVENQKEKNIIGNSINNEGEEEAKSKLIAHYSKLLPWIYYVLN